MPVIKIQIDRETFYLLEQEAARLMVKREVIVQNMFEEKFKLPTEVKKVEEYHKPYRSSGAMGDF